MLLRPRLLFVEPFQGTDERAIVSQGATLAWKEFATFYPERVRQQFI